jgi:hypothetical protein
MLQVLVPLAGLCCALGVLIGGQVGKVLLYVSAVLFGVASVLVLTTL